MTYECGSKNCSSLWRIYDTSDAKPTKRKIVFACGNDGSTKDHFIDDWCDLKILSAPKSIH